MTDMQQSSDPFVLAVDRLLNAVAIRDKVGLGPGAFTNLYDAAA